VARYDLAVIGSGQGGVPLALDFAKRGRSVVLFERGKLGGCCVNVGCTPSKAFLASAHTAGRARRGAEIGVHCEVRVDVPAVMDRVRGSSATGAPVSRRSSPRAPCGSCAPRLRSRPRTYSSPAANGMKPIPS
jgi:pyruvate/2-oxoglutarate dehydrogenase complex dihydrolipoamide dehydrogenase (E3) component